MVKKLNALKIRQNLGEILEQVYYKNDQYIIERAGKPMAAVVPVWQLEARTKRRDRLFGLVQRAWSANAKVKPGVIEREVETAVRAVRAKARRKTA
jgi:prevent-host-death family protein